jgi:uncharacterized protein YbjT (DUF2867 family)
VRALLEAGHAVRLLARDPARARHRDRPHGPRTHEALGLVARGFSNSSPRSAFRAGVDGWHAVFFI